MDIEKIEPLPPGAFAKALEKKGYSPQMLANRWCLSRRRVNQIIADDGRPRYYDDAINGIPELSKDSLSYRLTVLEQAMDQVRQSGLDGNNLAERIEGDIKRIMNTAYLNCVDHVDSRDKLQSSPMPVAARAAIDYSLLADNGLTFLRCWREGEFNTIRQLWPDAPEAIFLDNDLILRGGQQ